VLNSIEGARGGIGVYFVADSKFNISEPLPPMAYPQGTSQKAELASVARAMEKYATSCTVFCGL
jgi:hypothetical protein